MKKNINILRYSFITTFIFIFIVLYFIFFAAMYIYPNGYQNQTSPIMYIGFIIIILSFFLFFFVNLEKENKKFVKIKFLSENTLKILILGLMIITFFIPPISFSPTIIIWEEVSLINYFRAIIFIIGLAFLPGACLFNIIFPNSQLLQRFNVEPFLVKICIYPLLSFSTLGVSVLVLDFIGLSNTFFFSLILLFIILFIVFLDFTIQKIRTNIRLKDILSTKKVVSIFISKATLFIIFIAIGVSLISLGIFDAIHYLISGDSWTGIGSAIYIGQQNQNPVDYGMQENYPIFWGYISYGLSVLSGIPLININALLAPFCYLHVIVIYLFMRVLLSNFKIKYAVLSTILVSIFSGIFFLSPYDSEQAIVSSIFLNIGALTYLGELSYIYKSFSLNLVFLTIAIFILSTKNNDHNSSHIKKSLEDYKLIILASLFLLFSYMTYMLPLIIGLIIIFIYVLFSDRRRENFKHFIIFLISLFLLFLIFDLLTYFFNSHLFANKFKNFLIWFSIIKVEDNIIIDNLLYLFFISIISLSVIFYVIEGFYNKISMRNISNSKISQKYESKPQISRSSNSNKKKNIKKSIFIIFLSIFSIFLFLEIYNQLFRFYIYKFIFIEQNYWFYFLFTYLDKIYLYFGFLGILGIYLSYYSYKKNKKLFFLLISWLIIIFIYASFSFLKSFILDNLNAQSPQDIEYEQIKYMSFWYSRNYYYFVPVLCILSAIGIIKLIEKYKNKTLTLNYHKNLKLFIKLALISIIIIFSYSSVISTSIYWGRANADSTVKKEQAHIIGWVSKNIPPGAVILTEKVYNIYHGIDTMTFCKYYHIKELIRPDKDNEFNMNVLKNKGINYAILYNETHPEVNSNVSAFIDNYLLVYYFTEIVYQYLNLTIYTNNSLN